MVLVPVLSGIQVPMPTAQYRHLANEPLADVLQSLEKKLATTVIEIESPQGRGEISINNGRVLDAAFQGKKAADAVLAVLSLSAGRYRLRAPEASPHPEAPLLGSSLAGDPALERDKGHSISELLSLQKRAKQEPTQGAIRVGTRQVLSSNSSLPPAAQNAPAGRVEPAREVPPAGRAEAARQAPPAVHPTKTLMAHPMRTISVDAPKVEPARATRPLEPRPILATGTRTVISHPAGPVATPSPTDSRGRGSEGGTTVHSYPVPSAPPTAPLASHQAEERGSLQSARAPADRSPSTTVGFGSRDQGLGSTPPFLEAAPVLSAPIETKSSFLRTSIQGTAPTFQRSRPATAGRSRADDWDEEPVPSRRLERAALEQLEELNEAIQSSVRHPRAVLQDSPHPSPIPSSEPNPEPSPEPSPEPRRNEELNVEDDSHLPRVGRYDVLARLKRGGMGSVYLCRLTGSAGFQRLFAMKVLNAELSGRAALEAFFQEAELLSKLHHPNIVGIVDVGTARQPFLVLDYVEGGSLAELCQASPSGREPAKVVSIILDALTGIDAAHRATDEHGHALGIVHCDLTPHNLLVGVDGACRVADFGIATHRNRGPEVLRGKPAYVAPERLLGQPGDARSDLFSLGVVLYAALTGVEPFAAETPEATLQNVLHKPVASPSEVGFCPPPSLDWVCMKALARDPDDRFQTAEEMMVHLRKVAAREELLTSQAQVAEWVSSALRGNIENRRRATQRRSEEQPEPPMTEAPLPPGIGGPHKWPRAERSTDQAPPPPPSYATNEKTEYLPSLDREALERRAKELDGGPLSRIPRAISRLPKKRRIGFFVALGGMFLVLVLVLFLPSALDSLFTVAPDKAGGEAMTQFDAPKDPSAKEQTPQRKPADKPNAPAVPADDTHIELTDLPPAE